MDSTPRFFTRLRIFLQQAFAPDTQQSTLDAPDQSRMAQRITVVVSIVLFAIAYWVRYPTIAFALPYVPYVDEPYVVDLAFRGLREQTWLATSFWRPHLNLYTVMLAVIVDTQIHAIDWSTLPVDTDRVTALVTPYIAARTLYAAFGATTVVLVYHWATLMFPRWIAFVVAFTMAFMSFHIIFSGLLTPDILTSLVCTIFFYVATKYEQHPKRRYIDIMAFVAGVGTSGKYNFAALFVVLCFLIWRGSPAYRTWSVVFRSLLFTMLGFFLITPSILIHIPTFVRDFVFEFFAYHENTTVDNGYSGRFRIDLYLEFFSNIVLVSAVFSALLFGIVTLQRQRIALQAGLLLLAIQLCFFLSASYHFPRNFVFFIPIALMVSFWGIRTVCVQLAHDMPQRTRWITIAEVALYLLIVVPAVSDGYKTRDYFTRPYSLNVLDSIVGDTRPPHIVVGDFEPTRASGKPWLIPERLHTDADVAVWQAGGFGRFVFNSKLFADPKPSHVITHQHIDGDRDGGSGWPFDLIVTDVRKTLSVVGSPMSTKFGVDVLGVRIGRGEMRSRLTPLDTSTQLPNNDQPILINVYLDTTQTPVYPEALLFVHLLDANQQKVTQRDTPPVDYYPLSQWQAGDFVIAMGDLPVAALAPGTYQLSIGFYEPVIGQLLPIVNSPDGTYRVTFTIAE